MSMLWICLVLILGSYTSSTGGELEMDDTIRLLNETINRLNNALGGGVSHFSYAYVRPNGLVVKGSMRYFDHPVRASGYVIHSDGSSDYYTARDDSFDEVTTDQYESTEEQFDTVKKEVQAKEDHNNVVKRSITNSITIKKVMEKNDGTSKGADTLNCKENCDCDTSFEPYCEPPLEVTLDRCGCCRVCVGKQRTFCNRERKCEGGDVGNVCVYTKPDMSKGYCKVLDVKGCTLRGETYMTGQELFPECRILCVCHENKTATCYDICHSERSRPIVSCKFPKLVVGPDGCCGVWTCDSVINRVKYPECVTRSMRWSACSNDCGLGYSTRVSNDNTQCKHRNDTRLCYTHSCGLPMTANLVSRMTTDHHKIRHHRNCKNTLKLEEKVRLRIGNCISTEKHSINLCNYCSGYDCSSSMTYTQKIDFLCRQMEDPKFVTSVGKDILDYRKYNNIDTKDSLIFTADIFLVKQCNCKKMADVKDEKLKIVANATEQVPWIRSAFQYKEKLNNFF